MKQHSIFLLLIMLFLIQACSKAQKSNAQIEVSMGALIGATFSGGTLLQAKNEATGETTIHELHSPYGVTLPFGVWTLHLVGFDGSSDWQGARFCGGVSKYNFSADNQTVQISVNTANCASVPYPAIVTTKVTMWDVASWDSSVWQ